MMNDFVKTNGMFSEALGWSDNVNKADENIRPASYLYFAEHQNPILQRRRFNSSMAGHTMHDKNE